MNSKNCRFFSDLQGHMMRRILKVKRRKSHHSKLISAPDNPEPNKHKAKKMLKAFNFIVIRPPKLHIIMCSSFPTFLDCGIDIMWRHYEVMIAEFFTEPSGEPTGNRKVERIHSVNSFQCLNRRLKKSVKKPPKTNRSRIVLSESDDSQQEKILLF